MILKLQQVCREQGCFMRLAAFLLLPLSAGAEEVRFVPQLGLTVLEPTKIAYSPADDALLLVVNRGGRIDLFDVGHPGRPIKTGEIWASAEDAVFSPDGIRILSGGVDGTLRLWTLDGEPVTQPFVGHEARVRRVAYSPDGAHVASASEDGTVRLWTVDGEPAAEPLTGHRDGVRSVAFSPDGTLLVSGGADGTVRLWSVDGEPAAEPFAGHEYAVWSVAFSPDGTLVASAGSDTVRLWTFDGQPAAEPFRHDTVRSITFSRDGGRIASGGYDGTVRLWTLDGKPAADPIEVYNGWVKSVAFSPDDFHVAAASSDGTIRIWALDGKAGAEPFLGHEGPVDSVTFSPDGGRVVSGGDDGTVRIWNLDGSAATEPIEAHQTRVASVAVSPDGSFIASGGTGFTVRLWTFDGEPASELFVGHPLGVTSVAFSADGSRIVAGDRPGNIHLWTLAGARVMERFRGHERDANSVALSPDGNLIVSGGGGGGLDGIVRLWTVAGEAVPGPFPRLEGRVRSVDFSPDGSRIVEGGEYGIRLWSIEGDAVGDAQVIIDRPVSSVAFSPDGTRLVSAQTGPVFLLGSLGSSIRLWTLDGRPVAEPFEVHGATVGSVAVSPDGTLVVSGDSEGAVRLWTLDGRPVAEPLAGRSDRLQSVAASADGTRVVAAAGDAGTVRLWTLDGERRGELLEEGGGLGLALSLDGDTVIARGGDRAVRLWTLEGRRKAMTFDGESSYSLAISPDGSSVVAGGDDGTLRVWRRDGEIVAGPFEGHDKHVSAVAFSPDGRQIVSGGSDGMVRLWTVKGEPAAPPFQGHGAWIHNVAFSPDGTLVVSAGASGTVRLWTLDGQPAAAPFRGHTDDVRSVAFSPDGTRIVSAGGDGTVRLWTLEGRPAAEPFRGSAGFIALQYLPNGVILASPDDRIHVLNGDLEPQGQLFLTRDGYVAISAEGVHAPTDDLRAQVRAIGEDGTVLTRVGAVPMISSERVRQLLFDDFTLWQRVGRVAVTTARWIEARYTALGWFKIAFWPALAWTVLASFVFFTWIVTPHKVAHWAMPSVGGPELPRWQWIAYFITLVGFFGSTRRSLTAWTQMHHGRLSRQNFTARRPVRERERYCDLGHAELIADTAGRLARGEAVYVWIEGAGGTGKSALAYALLRRGTLASPRRPVPILVDEDWDRDLSQHVARLSSLEEENRGPTPEMIRNLGAMGRLCLLLDSLSERGVKNAEEQVAALVRDDKFRTVVVTSREPLPPGKIWERFRHVEAQPLSPGQVPAFIGTYAPEPERAEVERRLAPLLTKRENLSPLYLRFAIERALEGEIERTSWEELVLDYLEGLRAGRIDFGHDDMIRACRIAATEVLRDASTPRELDAEYLRGVLVREADELSFRNDAGTSAVDPAEVVEMLVSAGVLNRNRTNRRFLQFTYDPVAEQLARLRSL